MAEDNLMTVIQNGWGTTNKMTALERAVEYAEVSSHLEGWAQDCSNSNIFSKPLFKGNFDPFVNSANLGAIAHTSNGT